MEEDKQNLTVKDHLVSGKVFKIIKNRETGILETTPKPRPEEMAYYYNSKDYISHYNTKKDFISKCYRLVKERAHKTKLSICKREASKDNLHTKSLLDFGCGTGDFMNYCQQNGWSVKGIETSLEAIDLSSELIRTNIHHNTESVFKLHLRFDVITMWHSLEHVYNLDYCVEDLKKLLKPTGILVVACPNHRSYDALFYSNFWAAYDAPRHLWHFNKKSISKFFRKTKFRLIKTIPMFWDSFYISIVSEQNKNNSANYLRAFCVGLISNIKAVFNGEFSSLIYVFKQNGEN